MNGITFGDIHSFRDLNLIAAPFEEGVPSAKENYIDVPGADGGLDLTAAFGEVKYNYREFDLTFSVLPSDDWERKKRQVTNLLHGLECSIAFDRNPNYCLTGRVTVSDRKSDKLKRQIIIHAKTNPYWMKTTPTVYSVTLGESKNLAPRLSEWTCSGESSKVYIKNDIGTIIVQSGSSASRHINTNIALNGDEGTLSFSCVTSNNSIRCFYTFFDSSDNSTSSSSFVLTNGKYQGLTVPTGSKRLFFRVYPRSDRGDVIFSKFQIEQGSTCTAYEVKNGVLITNENKPVIPVINVSSAMTIKDSKKNSYSLSSGDHKILDIAIPTGESIITGTGSGTLTVKFTERAL